MKVSEKSLELNIGAELLGIMRNTFGMPKAYLRGLTQLEEKQEGVDFFVQLSPSARIFAFQFKAPRGRYDRAPYRYTLVRNQHDLLYRLAQNSPRGVFYVLPFFVTGAKLRQYVPNLLRDTWLLAVAPLSTPLVFGGQQTKVVRCTAGRALINPEYELEMLSQMGHERLAGVPAREFAEWYERYRHEGREGRKQRNPWLARGLRVAVVEPDLAVG